MFEHAVLVTSNSENIKLLKKMDLKMGRDFRSEKGAAMAGRPHQLRLVFKDRNKAIVFKLQASA